MEKLVYLGFRRSDESDADLAKRMLQEVAPELQRLGALRLKVCVVDDDVAPGDGLRIGRMEPAKGAFVSFWLEQSQERGPLEALLREATGDLAGYLVVESVPMPNTTQTAPLGQRTPGFNGVTCIVKLDELSHEEFIERWYRDQRDMAIEVQSTFGYVRNEIVRPLTEDAPVFSAIVEENFPADAMTDPRAFYAYATTDEELNARRKTMVDTVRSFLDLSKLESHPMSEYVFEA